MNIAAVLIASLLSLLAGYLFYGRLIAKKIGLDPARPTPAVSVNDGSDYIPTKPLVLFGHHYASIAAAGPIVGPTLALYYGVIPTWLWLILGVIFLGAVHDFTILFVSTRERGRSIAEIAQKTLGKPGFVFFVSFALLLCVLVTAAFLDLAARALTSEYPVAGLGLPADQTLIRTGVNAAGETMAKFGGIASTSVIVIPLCAPLIGFLLYRKQRPVWQMSVLAMGICVLSVMTGFWQPVTFAPLVWIGILSAYIVLAAWVPVWSILQPRDFINVHFLYLGLFGMIAGILGGGFAGMSVDAPSFNLGPDTLAALGAAWPFLFVTIACGACSGAHCLIASGTTSKQLASEKHALPIGYGGMLLESVLGICVTLCIVGGLGFSEYERIVWPVVDGQLMPGNAPLAFALAVGKTLSGGLGVPVVYGTLFGILLLEGFVLTTVDTIVRLERYLLEELWAVIFPNGVPRLLRVKAFNSALAVGLMLGLALTNAYQTIWPIFGTANQLLAALALIAVTGWFMQRGIASWFTAIPAVFMLVTTGASLVMLFSRYASAGNWVMTLADLVLLVLAAGVVVMTFGYFYRLRRKISAEAGSG